MEIREVENMLAKFRLVVGHSHRSTTAAILFGRTQCKIYGKKRLVIDFKSRLISYCSFFI